MTNRWFRFSYYAAAIADRPLLPHQLRDGDAALFLAERLAELGFNYAGVILNHPHFGPPPAEAIQNSIEVEQLKLGPHDLLLLSTRPPIDDWDDGVPRPVQASCTVLERRIFTKLKEHLQHCSRQEVKVADRRAQEWFEVSEKHHVLFDQNRRGAELGASIKKSKPFDHRRWEIPQAGAEQTLAYMIYEPHAWENGPGILNVFGLGGTETLAWAYLLSTRPNLRRLIGTESFVMAELTEKGKPQRPETLAFVDPWEVRLLTTDSDN